MVEPIDFSRKIVIIEYCVNCNSHNWNNRHDEAKYREYAHNMTAYLQERVPGV